MHVHIHTGTSHGGTGISNIIEGIVNTISNIVQGLISLLSNRGGNSGSSAYNSSSSSSSSSNGDGYREFTNASYGSH